MVRSEPGKSGFAAGQCVTGRAGKKVGVDLGAFYSQCMCGVSGNCLARVNACNSLAALVWFGSVFFSAFRWRWGGGRGEFLPFLFAVWNDLCQG